VGKLHLHRHCHRDRQSICALSSTGQVACAVRGSKSAIMVNQFNGNFMGNVEEPDRDRQFRSELHQRWNGQGVLRRDCNQRRPAGNGPKRRGVEQPDQGQCGTVFGAQLCGVHRRTVLCTARNSSGGLAWSLYNGTTWGAFANLTTSTVSAPSCTTDNNSGVICAVYTTGFTTLVNRFSGGAWQGFLNIGGTAGGEPDCTFWEAPGVVVCFAKGYNSGINVSVFSGGAWVGGDWSGYNSLGGEGK